MRKVLGLFDVLEHEIQLKKSYLTFWKYLSTGNMGDRQMDNKYESLSYLN